MLSLNVTVENDKVVIKGLQEMAAEMPQALKNTMKRGAIGTHREAFDFLSGAKGNPGGYPVPVETGHLRRLLDFLPPGKSKGGFSAGPLESIVYDSAIYSRTIHDGTGSSAKFGARPFITDGFEAFNRGDQLVQIADEEVAKVIAKRGFK